MARYEKRRSKSVEVSVGFVQGYTCAVAKLIEMAGCTTEAIDLYKAGGCKFEDFDAYGIDESDRETLLNNQSELTH